MENRRLLSVALFSLCAAPGFWAVRAGEPLTRAQGARAGNAPVFRKTGAAIPGANPNCRQWQNEMCTVCGIDSAVKLSLKNKTKTTLLECLAMKPGPASVRMTTHAEPAIGGLWEVELGLGYRTSARNECPHQFIASDHLPLQPAYEVGPITVESEIPPDGKIEAMACVGLSSARVGGEGKETGAAVKVFELRVVSQ